MKRDTFEGLSFVIYKGESEIQVCFFAICLCQLQKYAMSKKLSHLLGHILNLLKTEYMTLLDHISTFYIRPVIL